MATGAGISIFPISGTLFPAFLALFAAGYAIAYFIIFRRWPPNRRPDASSCFISLLHGSPAVALAATSLLSGDINLAGANTALEAAALDFSAAFFTVDLLHYAFMIPGDALFIAHHVGTLFVLATCRFVAGHGAAGLLVLLVLAEATSPCQNVWTLAGIRKGEIAGAARIHGVLTIPFYVMYTVARGVIGPLFFFKMSAFFLGGGVDGEIPRWVSTSWVVVVGGGIAGSVVWIANLWVERFRGKADTGVKKQR